MKQVFSAAECARELDRSNQYVRALIRNGLIKTHKIGRINVIFMGEIERIKREMPSMTRDEYRPQKEV